MLAGSDGLLKIKFGNFEFMENLSILALAFIIFNGGFSTRWSEIKPIIIPATLLSSLGTIITAIVTGLFCFLILKKTIWEGFLIGSIIASTDAASVFSILRSKNLNLKNGIGPLLELESGSNDPFSYLLTIGLLGVLSNQEQTNFVLMFFKQLIYGGAIGVIGALIALAFLARKQSIDGFYGVFLTAILLFSYAVCNYIDGNGLLCVYVMGIILGNNTHSQRRNLMKQFDVVSWLMQVILFFLLGLLSFPSRFSQVGGAAILIVLFVIFVARPIAVFSILAFFNFTFKEKVFISWVGLRGAASIVFAIMAVTHGISFHFDLFHIIFFVCFFSVSFQGYLIPYIARKLRLIR
jgi:cell volume regulation protein A